ncbi:MAG: MFS transporter [Planctomycetota bacterium]|jgi:hypothetical protein
MTRAVRIQLSIMMFLQFFIWGAWLPQSFGYWEGVLGFTPWQAMMLDMAFPISAILAMFFANQFADRNFAAEKFLAFSHLIGGVALLAFGFLARSFLAAKVGNPDAAANFWLFFGCMAIHCLFYVPTMSVTNTILFAAATNPQKDFGPIRLWGTIGWIAAAWPFIFILTDWGKVPAMSETSGLTEWLGKAMGTPLSGDALNLGKSWTFITAGAASLILAVLSLSLPHTPPKKNVEAGNSLAWVEALKTLVANPYLMVLFLVTAIDATVHDGFFFFAFTYIGKVGVAQNWVQAAMTVGQLAEIVTMLFLSFVLVRLGWRYTMAIGVFGHTARFLIWAAIYPLAGDAWVPWVAVAANVMHGICYAFFFATLYIFVDKVFPKDARTSAQGLFNLLVFGIGPIASRFVWRALNNQYTTQVGDNAITDYKTLLLFPAAAAAIGALLLLFAFHPPKSISTEADGPSEAPH